MQQLEKLHFLDLGSNVLTGKFPSKWPPALESLILADNDLEGPLSFLTTLSTLQVQDNALTGNLSSVDWSVYKNLNTLILNNNFFTGPIPGSFYVDLQSSLRLYVLSDVHKQPLHGDAALSVFFSLPLLLLAQFGCEFKSVHGNDRDRTWSIAEIAYH
jgi:hypothetical protein